MAIKPSPLAPTDDPNEPFVCTRADLRKMLDRMGIYCNEGKPIYHETRKLDEIITRALYRKRNKR